MRLAEPPRARPRETVVAMINLALLLLIFFLIVARLAPADPFEVTLPVTETGEPADLGDVLVVAADGRIGYADARGAAVWPRLTVRPEDEALTVRADAALDGAALARLLDRLAGAGVARVSLTTGIR